jgi:hypothetical protein
MKSGELVEFGDLMSYGNCHHDRTNSFGSTGCPYMAVSKGE